ncbi:outer membrane protein [Maritalea myrionectae]|uniref:Outer membrane protein beta-barrel domain-containing protein n=1 Tax=Maritalea myrionectae TaxID=454601 RepID=A0A2R4MF32_9HYPH|nr:hypothetical protein [Maritalea myrionectae]AVX04555.1 hypothetical protein MXMO3_02034 [Maritalea myrionectae]
MSILKKISIAMLASAAMTAGASAADPVIDYTPAPTAAPAYSNPGFDWNRFYAGVNGAYVNAASDVWGIGAIAGMNTQFDEMVFGFEVGAQANYDGGTYYGAQYDLTGRAGYLVSDDVLLYAVGGIGHHFGDAVGILGGGIEFAVSDDVTIGSEYNWSVYSGGTSSHAIDAKARWYFN